ncbi:MAG: DUF2163 domain-containing protein [Rickettsiaceae bacterium]|nr:MAG: DUF2163 domain-containing protein [Rickettsiaceae bacterium]
MSNKQLNISDEYNNFTYCFKIQLINSQQLYLTSANCVISHLGVSYLPASGLRLCKGLLNDSGSDYIILSGIYEPSGINSSVDIKDAVIEIFIFTQNMMKPYITYACTRYVKRDIEFDIYLQPISIKYNRNIINNFSRTCRAKFGDTKCKIDKQLYSYEYAVANITSQSIEVIGVTQEEGYFKKGFIHIVDSHFKANILSFRNNIFFTDQVIGDELKNKERVILIAGCDKEFITCCNKFNNAINFRGEPHIPQSNFLAID